MKGACRLISMDAVRAEVNDLAKACEADYDDLKEALGLISQHAAGTITQAEQLRRALAISERARERHSR